MPRRRTPFDASLPRVRMRRATRSPPTPTPDTTFTNLMHITDFLVHHAGIAHLVGVSHTRVANRQTRSGAATTHVALTRESNALFDAYTHYIRLERFATDASPELEVKLFRTSNTWWRWHVEQRAPLPSTLPMRIGAVSDADARSLVKRFVYEGFTVLPYMNVPVEHAAGRTFEQVWRDRR